MARIPHLELLRVMATVGIFVFHLWSVVPLCPHGGLFGPVLARLPLLGTLGVIVFNLITGFVLSMPYLGPQHYGPLPTVPDFWRRRFSRICLHYYPALLLWTSFDWGACIRIEPFAKTIGLKLDLVNP